MAGEDQERVEDYIALERYIADLQAGSVAHPPKGLTPEQVRIYRMAALFHSASPEAAEPSPQFAEALRNRLLALSEEKDEDETQKLPLVPAPHAQEAAAPMIAVSHQAQQQEQEALPPHAPERGARRRKEFLSRRAMMRGGAVAAASLVAAAAGAAVDRAIEQESTPPSPQSYSNSLSIDAGVTTVWYPVVKLADLGTGAVRFVTDALVGYVIRSADTDQDDKHDILAMSASCTHMGCLIQWQETDRRFHCPCHGGVFTAAGQPDNHAGALRYLSALPRLETKIEHGQVFVKVPLSGSTPGKPIPTQTVSETEKW